MIEWPRGGKNVFLQLDKKDPNNIAAIEESGQKITYGELVENTSHIRGYRGFIGIYFNGRK